MKRMFRSVDLIFLCCFFVAVESLTGKIQPPQNLSLSWSGEFYPQLNWTSPPHSKENCSYEVESPVGSNLVYEPFWSRFRVMKGGKMKLSVKTVCGQEESDWVSVNISYPDLVKNFQCFLESSQLTYCTWDNATNTQDLRFYFELADELSRVRTPLKECSSYRYSKGVKTGCNLRAKTTHTMNIVLNGTVDNKPVRNTFQTSLWMNVKPLPLNWTVTKDNNEFLIRWTPPDVSDQRTWTYKINYIECNENKEQREKGGTFSRLNINPQCRYRIRIRAVYDEEFKNIKTPWSEWKEFDAEKDPNTMLYALIIIPLVVAGMVLFIFMCYRKNKDKIFPKIPKPRDLLSDISDDSNKSTLQYLQIEEEDTCRISLVTDPHTEKNIS